MRTSDYLEWKGSHLPLLSFYKGGDAGNERLSQTFVWFLEERNMALAEEDAEEIVDALIAERLRFIEGRVKNIPPCLAIGQPLLKGMEAFMNRPALYMTALREQNRMRGQIFLSASQVARVLHRMKEGNLGDAIRQSLPAKDAKNQALLAFIQEENQQFIRRIETILQGLTPVSASRKAHAAERRKFFRLPSLPAALLFCTMALSCISFVLP